MSRRARLLRAVARAAARAWRAECNADGWHPLGALDRWREARWWLSTHAPHAAGSRVPVRGVRRWAAAWVMAMRRPTVSAGGQVLWGTAEKS